MCYVWKYNVFLFCFGMILSFGVILSEGVVPKNANFRARLKNPHISVPLMSAQGGDKVFQKPYLLFFLHLVLETSLHVC